MLSRSPASPLAVILLLVSACGISPSTRPPAPPGAAPPPALTPECELAHRQRERVAALLAEGKLDRTVRVIARADALCPESAGESSVALVETLAALGRTTDALAAADRIEADGKASPQALAAARAARATATEVGKTRPTADEAEKRIDAALAAKRTGDKAQAQRLFDRATVELEAKLGQPVHVETPNGLPVTAGIAWSPSGKLLAVAAYLHVSVIDAATLQERMHFAAPDAKIRAVAFSPDGKTLAACSGHGETVHLWAIDSGAERRLLAPRSPPSRGSAGSRPCTSVAWSPDGKSLATGLDASVELWDVASGKGSRKLDGHSDHVESVAWSPDGKMLASGALDHTVRVWDVASGKSFAKLEHRDWVYSVAWSPDGTMLASGAGNDDDARLHGSSTRPTVRVWDVASRRRVRELTGYGDDVKSVAWSPDGKMLASRSADQTVRISDIASGEEVRKVVLTGSDGCWDLLDYCSSGDGRFWPLLYTLSVAWSPDGKTFATGDLDGTLSLWPLPPGAPRTVHAHRNGIGSVAWSPDGKSLALGSLRSTPGNDDNTARIWDVASGKQSRLLLGKDVGGLASSPDGKTLAAYSNEAVGLWDLASGKEMRKLEGHGPVAWSPDGTMLASGSKDETLRIWDVASGKELHKLVEDHSGSLLFSAIAWSPDSRTVASVCNNTVCYKTVHLWDVASGREVRKLVADGGFFKALAWSPDSATLAAISDSDTVRRWDVASGQEQPALGPGHSSCPGVFVAWSPDGKMLAAPSCSSTGDALRLWDVASGQAVRELEDHGSAVAWSPDGKTLVSGSRDGAVHFWLIGGGEDRHPGAGNAIAYPVRGADAAYALTPGADPRYELFGDAARDVAVCSVGYLSFPIDLCEE
ncbi:MAG: WD40 repeat domain-containing protein, partial [Polyangiaceae bacterium]